MGGFWNNLKKAGGSIYGNMKSAGRGVAGLYKTARKVPILGSVIDRVAQHQFLPGLTGSKSLADYYNNAQHITDGVGAASRGNWSGALNNIGALKLKDGGVVGQVGDMAGRITGGGLRMKKPFLPPGFDKSIDMRHHARIGGNTSISRNRIGGNMNERYPYTDTRYRPDRPKVDMSKFNF